MKAVAYVLVSNTSNTILPNTIAVVVVGTNNIRNWLTNLNLGKKSYSECKDCKVHNGFYNHYSSLKDELDTLVKTARVGRENWNIIIVGHSLGASSGTLYANHLAKTQPSLQSQIYLYTFGSLRVGNEKFANYTNKLLKTSHIFRVVYK